MLNANNIKDMVSQLELLVTTKTHPNTIALFRAVTALWVIIGTLILAPAADQFYSLHSHIPLGDTEGLGFFKVLHILNISKYNYLYPFFIIGQLSFGALAGLSVFPRFSSAALYFFTMNLDNRASVILDGGNNLMHLILFFLIFTSPRTSQSTSALQYIDNMTSNFSLFVCRIQVALVYLTAGMLKLAGPLWTKGVALYYTMSVVEFGIPAIAKMMSHFPLIMVVATYGTVLFQISFPFLIWNRKARPLYMAVGTLLHLQISLVMGLFTFGLAMCTSYFCFYTDVQAASLINKFKSVVYNRNHTFLKKRSYEKA